MPELSIPTVEEVEAVILHIVDPPGRNRRPPGEARGLQLSELPLPAAAGRPVFRYFETHIEQALADRNVRAARFVVPSPDDGGAAEPNLLHALEELVGTPGAMVDGSGLLARRLYAVMDRRKGEQISSGDLAVCRCRGRGGDGDWSRFVAVMKIDPTEGFPQVVRKTEGGRSYVTVDVAEEVEILPTTRQELQKVAFFRPRDRQRAGYDMLLLDRQSRYTPRAVARFFATDFLGVEPIPHGKAAQTLIFVQELTKARNEARGGMSRTALHSHEKKVAKVVADGELDADNLPELLPAKQQQALKAALTAKLPAALVKLDSGYAKDLLATRRFRGDGGLRVVVPNEVLDDVLVEQTYVEKGPGAPYWKIVLHTKTWKEQA